MNVQGFALHRDRKDYVVMYFAHPQLPKEGGHIFPSALFTAFRKKPPVMTCPTLSDSRKRLVSVRTWDISPYSSRRDGHPRA